MRPLLIPACLLLPLVRLFAAVPTEEIRMEAPFPMPPIVVPVFKACPVFPITKFGAKSEDKAATSRAIAEAIAAANAAGGGVVSIPAGEWLTGKVHLRSDVCLRVEKGAVLTFDDKEEDYLPSVSTSWEGMECMNYSPLIYAYECRNVAIEGEGLLTTKRGLWQAWSGRPKEHLAGIRRLYDMSYNNVPVAERVMAPGDVHMRPHFIQFNRCKNVRMEGFSVRNSPFWTIHPYRCENVLMRGLNVYAKGHNNDGCDPEMTSGMLIEDCVFDQGDDAVSPKAGRNQEGWRSKLPTKNLVVRRCTVKNGHQLLAVGSELSGGIENIYVHDCRVLPEAKMMHLVFIKTNERMGGHVKNIRVENITAGRLSMGVLGIDTDVLYQWRTLAPTYVRKLTPIRDVRLKNIRVERAAFESQIKGQQELPVENILLKNVVVDKVDGTRHTHANVKDFRAE